MIYYSEEIDPQYYTQEQPETIYLSNDEAEDFFGDSLEEEITAIY